MKDNYNIIAFTVSKPFLINISKMLNLILQLNKEDL